MDNTIESVFMSYSDVAQGGNHDKVFNIHIIEQGGQYSVITENGRRGSRLQERIIARGLSSLAEAKRKFDAKEREKLNHRETPYTITSRGGGASGQSRATTSRAAPTSGAPVYEATGFKSDFPKPCTEEDALALIAEADWYAEQKLDGQFLSVLYKYGRTSASNKLGRGVPVPSQVAPALEELARLTGNEDGLGLAGEFLDGALHVFNVWEKKGTSLTRLPYELRASVKDSLGQAFGNHLIATGRGAEAAIKFVYTARSTAEKRELYDKLKSNGAEGIVFKNASAEITPGAGRHMLKLKWVETVDCLVTANEQRSLQCFVYAGGELVSVGSVTCKTEADHQRVREANARGEQVVCEIRYLYASGKAGRGGQLIQPVFLRFRDDVEPESCKGDNLKTTNKAVQTIGDEASRPEFKEAQAVEDSSSKSKKARRTNTLASPSHGGAEDAEVYRASAPLSGETLTLFN